MSRETYSYDVPDMCLDMNDDRSIDVGAWFDGKENDNQEVERPNEVVRSMEEWHPTRQENVSPPRRVAKKLSAQRKSAQRRLMAKRYAEKVASTLASKDESPPRKKQKMRRGPSTTGKSTEELKLLKMQQLQQEVAELRRKSEESLKVAIAEPGQPMKTSSHITKPMDLHFCTDERLKQHVESQPATEYKEVDFEAALRKHPPPLSRASKGPTITKPFNHSCGKKRKLDEAATEYIPLAQQVENFQKRTPQRYHLRNRKEEEGPSRPLKPQLTNPKNPCLETKRRLRPPTCKSAAELENKEITKLQQYRFKAQELNYRILEGGPLLPKKPPMKELTKPIGFNLEIKKQIQERETKKVQEEEPFEFHSRPCLTRILEDVVGVPEKKTLPITVPKSLAFALKNKVGALVREEKKEKVEEVAHVIKAKPMLHPGVPFKPKATEPRLVETCPFSFDARDKERLLQKEKKIKELQKEEVPKFKANPLPQFDHIYLPEKKVKRPTKPEPFQLAIDARGAVRQEIRQQQLKEEMKRQKEAAVFKAQPSQVLHQEPFLPKKESKLLLAPDPFVLATELRAKERLEFEIRLAELEAEKARLQEAIWRMEEERAKEERAKLQEELERTPLLCKGSPQFTTVHLATKVTAALNKRDLETVFRAYERGKPPQGHTIEPQMLGVHKANPIRKYANVEIKPSDQPMTVPQSPNFSDRFQR